MIKTVLMSIRRSFPAIGMVMSYGVFSGCLLEPLNHAPELPMISGPSELSRNVNGVYTVAAVDPDNQPLDIAWGHVLGDCTQDLLRPDGTNQVEPKGFGKTYGVSLGTLGPVCIWVRVRDSDGASASAATRVQIVNSAPIAVLSLAAAQAEGGISLYGETRVSAKDSSDPDLDYPLLYAWSILGPKGGTTRAEACADNQGDTLCFRPSDPGIHTISLLVTDNAGQPSSPATMQLVVKPDQPPCLRDTEQTTSLRLRRFDEAVAFGVAVEDDGDPFPPRENEHSELRFFWYFRQLSPQDSPWLPLVRSDRSSAFRLPSQAFGQGDEVQVRVEVSDRASEAPVRCRPEDELCESSPGCTQRLTWTVRYWL